MVQRFFPLEVKVGEMQFAQHLPERVFYCTYLRFLYFDKSICNCYSEVKEGHKLFLTFLLPETSAQQSIITLRKVY